MKKVSFYTLGCKLNQAETAVLAEQFERSGYQLVPFGQPVDVCVINTCSVTAKSDFRCRQMIRKAQKISPAARIAVVGCYAQLSPEKIQQIPGVEFILGSDRKFDLSKLIDESQNATSPVSQFSDNMIFKNPSPGNFWNHTRAFLKIQDGCDSFCSYCTVPLARGRSRSDSLDHIVQQAIELAARGHREIVVTGVHIGRYGKDLNPTGNLLEVLKRLESIANLDRIRLSSLEPLEIEMDLIHWIAQSKKICRHFHIPLQSGDDEILKKMNRNYDSRTYIAIIDQIKNAISDCGLGTDIIVGFPGETEHQFQQTVRLVERLPFTYLHVFSFSSRPGTAAASFPGRVAPGEIKRRSEILRKIGRQKKQAFYQHAIGQKMSVLWEEKTHDQWLFGWTDNYIRVRIPWQSEWMNKICQVEIIGAKPDFVKGKVDPDYLKCVE